MDLRGLMRKRGDALLAGGLLAVYLVEISTQAAFVDERLFSIPFAIAFCSALGWRRRAPLVPLALALVIIEVANLAAPPLAETGAFLFGVVIAIYSAAAYTEGRLTLVAGILVAAAIPLGAIEPGSATTLADIGFFLMFFGGPFVAGRVIRARRARERTLEGRAVELEQAGRERALAAVAEERARIARELHDVVSHALSVMLLQARGARRVLSEDETVARGALDTIERSGREALEEMRRLLSVLRQSDEQVALAPQPSLSRVGDLVESVRGAGLPVELSVEGEIDELPPGVDVSAYRIVQEALTNALKHAGPARARVVIRRSGTDLEIEVIDDGEGGTNADGTGQGLEGMRERVAVYGGRLEAGERVEGGYSLRARLPLGSGR